MKIGDIRIGLALGGGAIRGAAHLGVLSVFEEEGIPISVIAGTSAGAIVGGNYALNPSSTDLFKKLSVALYMLSDEREKLNALLHTDDQVPLRKKIKDIFRKGLFYGSAIARGAMVDPGEYEAMFSHLIDDVEMSSLPIPFIATAVDIRRGGEVHIKKGSLRKAVMASSAIPGVFPPVEMDGMLLVDGGWLHPVPIAPLVKEELDLIIAIDISPKIKYEEEGLRGVSIILRTNAITRNYLKDLQLRWADVVITPDVGDVHAGDISRFEFCYRKGVEAARLSLDRIFQLAREKKRVRKRRSHERKKDIPV